MNSHVGWSLVVEHDEELPIGSVEGRSEVKVVPPPDGSWPERGVVLRLEMPRFRPIVRVLLLRDAPDGTVASVELSPKVWVEKWCFHEYPVEPADGADAVRFELHWQMQQPAEDRRSDFSEQLIARVQLFALDPDGADQYLTGWLLRTVWRDPAEPTSFHFVLRKAATGPSVPAPVVDAVAEFIAADESAVPGCGYCALGWKLNLLNAADRALAAAEQHGSVQILQVLAGWDLTMDGRMHFTPCHCWRQNPSSRPRPAEIPADEMRHDVDAARARYLARCEAARRTD